MNKQELINELNLARDSYSNEDSFRSGVRTGLGIALGVIEKLDESEVLSKEWIDEHKRQEGEFFVEYEVVPVRDLQNLLEPKQELPVIPKYVAEYLEIAKSDVPLMRVLELANTRKEWPKWKKEYDWISANDETFARAWVGGYEVEKEKLYYVLDKNNHTMLYRSFDYSITPAKSKEAVDPTRKNFNLSEYELTEQEIRGYDPRFMAFAVEVTE